jgi:hypothetical protein
MEGSLIFVCRVVKAKSSAYNEDIEGGGLYSLSCLLVTFAYSEVLVKGSMN